MPKDTTTATEQAALVMNGCQALTDAMVATNDIEALHALATLLLGFSQALVADPKQDYPMPDFNPN